MRSCKWIRWTVAVWRCELFEIRCNPPAQAGSARAAHPDRAQLSFQHLHRWRLHSLCQWTTCLTIKKKVVLFHENFLCFTLCLFPFLSVRTTEERLLPPLRCIPWSIYAHTKDDPWAFPRPHRRVSAPLHVTGAPAAVSWPVLGSLQLNIPFLDWGA